MWDQKFLELFVTIIPQQFAIFLMFFSLANIKIEKKAYVLFSILSAILVFLIRPNVNFGVHTIISLVVWIAIAVMWGKANVLTASLFAVITFATVLACELATFSVLGLLKFDMALLKDNAQVRTMIGFIPLGLLFAIALTIFYVKKSKKKKEEIKDAV